LRHAAIAIGLAVLVGVTTILRPVDMAMWALQAKLFERPASGDIVFVEVEKAPASDASTAENQQLLLAINQLEARGVARIYVDTPIRRSSAPALDAELRNALINLTEKVILTRAARRDVVPGRPPQGNDRFFESGMKVVSSDYLTDFLGYVWWIESSHVSNEIELPSLWTKLAGGANSRDAIFLDYSIDLGSVPRYDFDKLRAGARDASVDLTGKAVLLGPSGTDARIVKIPGQGFGPSSLVHIIAAETAMRGAGQSIDWPWLVGAFGISLIAASTLSRRPRLRRLLYLVWASALIALVVMTAYFGIRALFGEILTIGLAYAGLRSTVNFKRRHLFVEPRSNLPNFSALQRDLGDHITARTSIVVAKIARLDAVFTTLTRADQGRYLRQLSSRLSLGESRTSIYYDGGKYFAFVIKSAEYQNLEEHLEGLRAIASQSITVSQRVLDVSMTMGVDQSHEKSISSRLSAAIAAADQAREAYRPVFIISDFAADSEEWDYSLQARLESALSEDRISIKLQPQADLRDGRIVGVEALARWVDAERGEIPPSRFILQCERVGRLDELTKRILSKSLDAVEALQRRDHDPRMSVNVSAIQFVDSRIAEMIEKNIALHSIDPTKLTIEVTETARIEDFSAARGVFEQIKQLGVSFSIDDFGVASANLEAMFQLPFDEIKIDQMFVRDMHCSETARAIVANVVRLASDAGLTSVAEGIEDRETYALLRDIGCDLGQGYYIARPMALSQIQEILTLQRDSPLLREKFG
jgi:EAL domain-containing protein (putative c-di-GMP-specific phosphodiesterase class I)